MAVYPEIFPCVLIDIILDRAAPAIALPREMSLDPCRKKLVLGSALSCPPSCIMKSFTPEMVVAVTGRDFWSAAGMRPGALRPS